MFFLFWGWETVSGRRYKTPWTELFNKIWATPPKNMWNELEMTASFQGVGSLNLQQLSSVLSSLCPGMLAEARNLPRTFLQNDGDRKWISWDQFVNLYLVGDSSWTSSWQLCLQQFLPFLLCLRQMLVYSSGASLAVVGFPTISLRRRAVRSASVLPQVLLGWSKWFIWFQLQYGTPWYNLFSSYFHLFSSFLAVWLSSPRRLWKKSEMPLRSICSCVDCQPCSRYLSVLSHFWGPHSWRVFRMCLFSLYIWQDCDKCKSQLPLYVGGATPDIVPRCYEFFSVFTSNIQS